LCRVEMAVSLPAGLIIRNTFIDIDLERPVLRRTATCPDLWLALWAEAWPCKAAEEMPINDGLSDMSTVDEGSDDNISRSPSYSTVMSVEDDEAEGSNHKQRVSAMTQASESAQDLAGCPKLSDTDDDVNGMNLDAFILQAIISGCPCP